MSFTSYATVQALTDWLGGTAPANPTSLLRSATALIAKVTFRDPYTDAPTGENATALSDATCAQVAAWIALNINPDAAGLDTAPVRTSKIGTASVEHDTTGQALARQTAATQLAPTAVAILQAAGLLTGLLPLGADDSDELANYGLSRPLIGDLTLNDGWPFGSVTDAMAIDAFSIDAWE